MKFLAETFKLFKSILFTEAWRAWWSCPTCKLTRQYSGDLKIVTERVYNSLPTRLHYTLTVLACLSFSLLVTTRWPSENFHNVTMRWGASCWELSIVISWNRSWILVHHCAYIYSSSKLVANVSNQSFSARQYVGNPIDCVHTKDIPEVSRHSHILKKDQDLYLSIQSSWWYDAELEKNLWAFLGQPVFKLWLLHTTAYNLSII